ncbi:MAG: spore coat associated protein CotJA [Clostridia bacterium]|nr:spore coat associated protein CotJA [Clostridia bacterium]
MDITELPLGYAFVPPQTTFNTYTPEMAIEYGTLFPELNLPLCEYLRGVKEDKCNGR